jgi:hypothetical protein
VVGDIAACGIGVQPFTDIALDRASARRQLGRRLRFRPCQGFIQPQLVANPRERRKHRGAKIGDDLPQQLLELRLINRCHE